MYQWKDKDWDEAWGLVVERDPREFSWGFYQHGLSMGSVGGFSWYESQNELLDFIAAEIRPYEDEELHIEMKTLLEDVLRQADLSKGLTPQLRKRINSIIGRRVSRGGVLYYGTEILWWGQFSDLCAGKGAFARELVRDFLEYQEIVGEKVQSDEEPAAIASDYVPQFVEYAKEYGK